MSVVPFLMKGVGGKTFFLTTPQQSYRFPFFFVSLQFFSFYFPLFGHFLSRQFLCHFSVLHFHFFIFVFCSSFYFLPSPHWLTPILLVNHGQSNFWFSAAVSFAASGLIVFFSSSISCIHDSFSDVPIYSVNHSLTPRLRRSRTSLRDAIMRCRIKLDLTLYNRWTSSSWKCRYLHIIICVLASYNGFCHWSMVKESKIWKLTLIDISISH